MLNFNLEIDQNLWKFRTWYNRSSKDSGFQTLDPYVLISTNPTESRASNLLLITLMLITKCCYNDDDVPGCM